MALHSIDPYRRCASAKAANAPARAAADTPAPAAADALAPDALTAQTDLAFAGPAWEDLEDATQVCELYQALIAVVKHEERTVRSHPNLEEEDEDQEVPDDTSPDGRTPLYPHCCERAPDAMVNHWEV